MNTSILAFIQKVFTRQIVTISLTIILLFSAYSPAAKVIKQPNEITFLTWDGYINKNIVDRFESEYDAKINFIYFESDNARNELLTRTGSAGYDLLLLDASNISFYKKLAWIQPLNSDISYSFTSKLTHFNDRSKTCAPYSWGTTGLAYRTDLTSAPLTSWKQLFSPSSELYGKILMPNISNEVVGMALKSLGYSMLSENHQELEQARQLLLTQAPAVAGYSPIATDPLKAKLVTGEASAILTYSGDALMLKAIEPRIEYIIPEEGGAVWADFICLSGKTKKTQLAQRFIDYINQPRQAAENALFIYSATANSQAKKLLPDEFVNNPIIYPNEQQVEKSESYKPLSADAIKIRNSIMNELQTAHR